jgi:hypothetical protein
VPRNRRLDTGTRACPEAEALEDRQRVRPIARTQRHTMHGQCGIGHVFER